MKHKEASLNGESFSALRYRVLFQRNREGNNKIFQVIRVNRPVAIDLIS